MSDAFERYQRRFTVLPQSLGVHHGQSASLAVVVPIYDEPEPTQTLDLLSQCAMPQSGASVFAVVNGPQDLDPATRARIDANWAAVSAFADAVRHPGLTVMALDARGLPSKRAGVGVARKIGMDAAVARMALRGDEPEGVIACLDADCQVEKNYLEALDGWRCSGADAGAALHFEHPLEHGESSFLKRAIAEYELGLRYYVLGMEYARLPFAYHTVGSSMAVRAGAYLSVGGMNQRKAGEDFYFLHKVAAYGGVATIAETTVRPAARDSYRVPFGTGRAMGRALQQKDPSHWTYPWEAFEQLATWHTRLIEATQTGYWNRDALPAELGAYSRGVKGEESMRVALASSPDPQRRLRAAYQSFDAFWMMKWLNHARDHVFGSRAVVDEALGAWERFSGERESEERPALDQLLTRYRDHDRARAASRSLLEDQ